VDLAMVGQGFVLGFAIAAPVGPIGLLCIQRTLNQGQLIGLVSGLGAATADAMYGAIAAFGLTLVTAFLVEQQIWLGLVGGVFLCYLGVRTSGHAEAKGVLGAYASTFALTVTNPLTILMFAAIFAGAGLANNGSNGASALSIVVGVFCGSATWWLLLSAGVGLLRTRVNETALLWVNRVAGAVIIGFGLLAVLRVVGVAVG
jgi:threonine/homoserine/homoserine lactone efflux protein